MWLSTFNLSADFFQHYLQNLPSFQVLYSILSSKAIVISLLDYANDLLRGLSASTIASNSLCSIQKPVWFFWNPAPITPSCVQSPTAISSSVVFYCLWVSHPDQPAPAALTSLLVLENPRLLIPWAPCTGYFLFPSCFFAIYLQNLQSSLLSGHISDVIFWMRPSLTIFFYFFNIATHSPTPRNPSFSLFPALTTFWQYFTFLLIPCSLEGTLSVLFTDVSSFCRMGPDSE